MPYLEGDSVMPLGQVPHSGQPGVVISTTQPMARCLVRFEDGSEEEYEAGVLTLTEREWQTRIRRLVWGEA